MKKQFILRVSLFMNKILEITVNYKALCIFLVSSCVFSCAKLPDPFAQKENSTFSTPRKFAPQEHIHPEIAHSLTTLFKLQSLTQLVNKAMQDNQDVKLAISRLNESGFNYKKTRASLFPSLNYAASGGRDFIVGSSASGSYTHGVDASWEIDLWKKLKSNSLASAYDYTSAKADVETMRQSVSAQVMQAWFTVAENNALLKVSKNRLHSFQKTYNLINSRFDNGTANLAELDLAKIDVENTKASLSEITETRDRAVRSLQVLVGSYPDAKLNNAYFPALNKGVKAGVPSSVLLRRPDVQAAFSAVQAADSRMKVAHADQFPNFSLTSSLGSSATQLKNLASLNYTTFSILGSLTTPLIDNEKRKAELGASTSRAEQAYLNYQKILLNALSEVENALSAETTLRAREQITYKALRAARNAETRIQKQYENGTIELLSYLDTQRRKFTLEETKTKILAQRYRNRVSLALALGIGK